MLNSPYLPSIILPFLSSLNLNLKVRNGIDFVSFHSVTVE